MIKITNFDRPTFVYIRIGLLTLFRPVNLPSTYNKFRQLGLGLAFSH